MKTLIDKMYTAKAWCLIGILSLSVASCIEEGENAVDGKGSNFIRIIASEDAGTNLDLVDSANNPAPTLGMNRASAAFEAFPVTAQFLEIRRDAISNSDLNEAISVTFEIDNTIVDTYNAYIDSYNDWVDVYNLDLDRDNDEDKFEELDELDHQSSFIILEEERYSIASFTVNFAAGEHTKYVPMTLDPTGEGTDLGSMDFSAAYGLGVKITSSPSNYKMTSEGDNILIQIVVKNQWDGVYSFGPGEIERYTAGTLNAGDPLMGEFSTLEDRSLVTRSANEVYFTPLWATGGGVGGINGTYIIITPTPRPDGKHAVTMACETNPTMVNISDDQYDNTYDPATKTFKLAFEWGTANKRKFWTELKFKNSR
jgi:hypothetical protein